jgi:hypothetical protein
MCLVERTVYRLVESKVYIQLFESITRIKEQTNSDGGKVLHFVVREGWLVYFQLNKKKAKAEGKKCHAKTMWSQ